MFFNALPVGDSTLFSLINNRDLAESTAASNHVAFEGTANRWRGLRASTPSDLTDGTASRDDHSHALTDHVVPRGEHRSRLRVRCGAKLSLVGVQLEDGVAVGGSARVANLEHR